LQGGPIRVSGDGTPYRSYLYAADLAVWLWTLLLKGGSLRPYNSGSDNALSIAELANLVKEMLLPGGEVVIARQPQPGQLPSRYVPSTERALHELGLQTWVSLPDAIRRTAAWYAS
jgi:dTDP-glucose 4,6-dehydratase